MIINHNISAMNSKRILTGVNKGIAKNMEKLSSGLRINRAGDDAAGLAISEKMRGQIGGLDQAARNAQDGISLIQTAEGALEETHSILQRMRTLAVQSSSDTNVTTDRSQIQTEIIELASELNRISSTTEFNTRRLLADGTTGGSGFSAKFHIGSNSGQSLTIQINNMSANTLGVSASNYGATNTAGSAITLMNQSAAESAISLIDDAIGSVSTQRAKLGAAQNRLEHTIANLGTAAENLQGAESRIRDVDIASETLDFAKNQVLGQSGTAMFAQSKARTQSALQLL